MERLLMMQMRNGGSADEDKEHLILLVPLSVLLSTARAAHDKYTVKTLNGAAFSEFRGYEAWQDVAVSQTDEEIKAILGNAVMINTYREGSLLPVQYACGEKRLHLHGPPSKASGYEGDAPTCF
jgi:hypothetical protein